MRLCPPRNGPAAVPEPRRARFRSRFARDEPKDAALPAKPSLRAPRRSPCRGGNPSPRCRNPWRRGVAPADRTGRDRMSASQERPGQLATNDGGGPQDVRHPGDASRQGCGGRLDGPARPPLSHGEHPGKQLPDAGALGLGAGPPCGSVRAGDRGCRREANRVISSGRSEHVHPTLQSKTHAHTAVAFSMPESVPFSMPNGVRPSEWTGYGRQIDRVGRHSEGTPWQYTGPTASSSSAK